MPEYRVTATVDKQRARSTKEHMAERLAERLANPSIPLKALRAIAAALESDPFVCVGSFCEPTPAGSEDTHGGVGCLLTAAALTMPSFRKRVKKAGGLNAFAEQNSLGNAVLTALAGPAARKGGIKRGEVMDALIGVYNCFDMFATYGKRSKFIKGPWKIEVLNAKGRRELAALVDGAIAARTTKAAA